jgi:hypothetical protein
MEWEYTQFDLGWRVLFIFIMAAGNSYPSFLEIKKPAL